MQPAESRNRCAVGVAPVASRDSPVLTESLLLSVAGGLAGLALAFWGVQLLVGLIPRTPESRRSRARLPRRAFTLPCLFLQEWFWSSAGTASCKDGFQRGS
jgi:hypothetical protein